MKAALASIESSITALSKRIENIETKQTDNQNQAQSENLFTEQSSGAEDVQVQDSFVQSQGQYDESIRYEASASRSIQKECDVIKERLAKISLPGHMKLNENSVGIKQESKPVLRVMSRTARITETALKQLTVFSLSRELPDKSFKLSAEDIDILFTLLGGIINFLQSEYTSLIVKNTFDDETSRLFKSFENHSSAFNQHSLNNLKIAADLAIARDRALATSTRRQQQRGSYSYPRGSGFRNFRGRGFSQEYHNYRRPPMERQNVNDQNFSGNL